MNACGPTQPSLETGAAGAAETAGGWPPLPEPGPVPSFEPPGAERFTLSNGIPVTLVQAGKVPLVEVIVHVRTGSSADPAGKGGLSDFTADMLNEGTKSRSALQISEELQTLASAAAYGASLDYMWVSVNCLEEKLDPTLAILADLLQNPVFDAGETERVRQEHKNALIAQKDELPTIGWKAFTSVLYGDRYAGRPSEGTLESLQAIAREDLVDWHRRVWTADNAGIVVAGRLTRKDVQAKLEKHLAGWRRGDKSAPAPAPVTLSPHGAARVYWVDRPGAEQSYLILGDVGPAWDAQGDVARTLANLPLGGTFSSRINLNLREDKGYTYGARSVVAAWQQGGLFYATASVKTATTAPSIHELLAELARFVGDEPLTPEEFDMARSRTLQLEPQRYESLRGTVREYSLAEALGRPAGWLQSFGSRVRSVSRMDAHRDLASALNPAGLAIVVVGDWSAAGGAVEALGVGPIVHLDEEGRPKSPL